GGGARRVARRGAVLPRGAGVFSRVTPSPPPRLFSARRCETASNEAISNLQGDETAMALRCAILDDYQNVALKLGDWSKLKSDVEFKVFNDHLGGADKVIAACQGF